MIDKLKINNDLSQKEVQEIIYSMQVASGYSRGVGKVKGILEYLRQSPVKIMNKKIHDKYQLEKLIQSIDGSLYISSDQEFKDYF